MTVSSGWDVIDNIDASVLEKLDPKLHYGFVYEIENRQNGMLYIGKKFFWSKRSKMVKGKKKSFLAESDWRSYWGSSKSLLADIETSGESNFRRTILHLCSTKSQCGYLEAKEQFARDVLLDTNYYNEYICCRINSKHMQRFVNEKSCLQSAQTVIE
jgi:hypothetical protein